MNQRNGMHEDRGFSRNGSEQHRDERARRSIDERSASPREQGQREQGRWESEGGRPGRERHWDGGYYAQSREPRVYERDDRFSRERDDSRYFTPSGDTSRPRDASGYGTQQWNGTRQGSQSYGIGSFDGGYGGRTTETSGKAPKNYTRSDDRLREDVCESLARSGHDWSDVDVQVTNGEVTLTGTVSDRSEKLHAEHLADRVRGVNEVTNQIKIKRAEGSDTSEMRSSSMTDHKSDNNGSRKRAG